MKVKVGNLRLGIIVFLRIFTTGRDESRDHFENYHAPYIRSRVGNFVWFLTLNACSACVNLLNNVDHNFLVKDRINQWHEVNESYSLMTAWPPLWRKDMKADKSRQTDLAHAAVQPSRIAVP